jgi:aminopeptidase N
MIAVLRYGQYLADMKTSRSISPGALALTVAVVLFPSPNARGDAFPRQPGVDVLHYTFRLTLGDANDEIVGETTARVRLLKEGVTELVLDLATQANGKGMAVTAVTADEKPVPHVHEKNRLRVTLEPASRAGEERTYKVSYHGVPVSGLHIGPNKYGERTFFSENWPDKARQWLPVIDHPYDKATSEFIVTAPARYQVVANGLLQEEIDLGDGRRQTHWKQSVPIATWLNSLGVAQFASHHAGQVRGVPLETWVFHQDREAGMIAFEGPARKAIEFYSDFIGPYPYEKLANIQAVGFSGGMEHASAIFYGERSFTGRPASSLVAHEIAHQWFGDSVTEKDWDDVWLSEGFATYFALLYTEHYEGKEKFQADLKRSKSTVLATEKRRNNLGVIHDNIADSSQILNQLVYQKGGWTLHMLRGQIGTAQFQAGIRDYYKKFRDGNASTDDFRAAMERASGQELDWFFRQWLKRPGSPVIEGAWDYDAAAKRVRLTLAQKQPGEPYRLPMELGILGQDKAAPMQIVRIEMQKPEQSFEFPIEQEPREIVLDPGTWILMQGKLAKK